MHKDIYSLRELQRNYRKLINKAKRTKQPIYVGAYSKPEAVLLDVDEYERVEKKANGSRKKSWKEIEADMEEIRKAGRQDVNLADFVHADRQSH